MRSNVLPKAPILTLLHSEGTNYCERVNVLCGNIGDLSSRLRLLSRRCFDAASINADDQKEHRSDREGEECILGADKEHHHGHADERQNAGEEVHETIVDEFLNI